MAPLAKCDRSKQRAHRARRSAHRPNGRTSIEPRDWPNRYRAPPVL